MNIVVTGSIAFDYLMSFPGKFTEHFLPEHMHRVSLSFLVDTMDKRRGGCAPNIAYTLALLGERPLLMATAGQDFGDYRRVARGRRRRHVARPQIARQVHGVVLLQHRRGEQPDRVVLHRGDGARGGVVVPDDRGLWTSRSSRRTTRRAMMQYAEECRDARHPVHLRSGPAVRAHVGRRAARRPRPAPRIVICNDYELELIRQKTGLGEADILARATRSSSRAASTGRRSSTPRGRVDVPAVHAASHRRSDRRRRRVSRRAPEGTRARAPTTVCARLGSVAATYALEHLGGQSHAYTWDEFTARYEEHFGPLERRLHRSADQAI